MMASAYFVVPVIIFFASFVHCIVGFGDALLLMPFLLMFFTQGGANTVASTYSILISGFLIFYQLHYIKRYGYEIVFLFIGYVALAIVGYMVLRIVNPNYLVIMLSCILIIYPVLYLVGSANARKIPRWCAFIFGGVTGFLGSTIAINGPPVILYCQLRKIGKEGLITIAQPIFVLGSLVNLFGYFKIGILDIKLMLIAVASFPIIIINAFIGRWIRSKIAVKQFHWVVVGLIFISGCLLLGRTLIKLV